MRFNTPDNVSNMVDFLTYTNEVTSSAFGIVVVILVFVIFMVVFSRWGGIRAFTMASFVASITAIFFRVLGLVNDIVILFAITALILGLIGLRFTDE